jgi:hypothetical protein
MWSIAGEMSSIADEMVSTPARDETRSKASSRPVDLVHLSRYDRPVPSAPGAPAMPPNVPRLFPARLSPRARAREFELAVGEAKAYIQTLLEDR